MKSQIIDLKDLKSLIFSTDNFDNSSVSKLKPKCQIFRQSKESQFWFFQNKLFWKYSNKGPFLVLSVRKCTVNDETKRSKKTTVDEMEPMVWTIPYGTEFSNLLKGQFFRFWTGSSECRIWWNRDNFQNNRWN